MWMLLLLTMMQHPPFLSMAAPPILSDASRGGGKQS
jgi:hypothetical protein